MALTDFSESSGERNIESYGQLLFTDFSSDQWSRISEFYYQEADRREKKIEGEKKDIFREDKSSDKTSILHSDGVYSMKNKINSSLTDFSSFPWQEFSGDMKILEKETKVGKAHIFYPNGMTMAAYDEVSILHPLMKY